MCYGEPMVLKEFTQESLRSASPTASALVEDLVEPKTIAVVGQPKDILAWVEGLPGLEYSRQDRRGTINGSNVIAIDIEDRHGLRGPQYDRVIVVGPDSDMTGRAISQARMITRGSPGDVFWYDPDTDVVTRWCGSSHTQSGLRA